VVVSAGRHDGSDVEPRRKPAAGSANAAVWHDLECGSYTADLPLWRELAGAPGERAVLDIGAGTGRVALDLAHQGHHVTAVDRDAALLVALRERAHAATGAGTGTVEAVCADARALALEREDFGVCLVPMQTIQMFGGADGRAAFLRGARAHLAPGAVLACAIVTEVDAFDCAAGDLGPSAELARVAGATYISRATLVHVGRRAVRIERERRIVAPEQPPGGSPGAPPSPAPAPALEHDVVELDRVSVPQLEREGRDAGLTVMGTREIPATSEHTASVAVIFGA
jgi:SAM-dependent methyltransferase